MPKARLPASLPRAVRFNETLGIDPAAVEDPWGIKHMFANMVWSGTLFQLFKLASEEKASVVGDLMQEAWGQYFGAPVTIIADLGTELTGAEFQDRCDRADNLRSLLRQRSSLAERSYRMTRRHDDTLSTRATYEHASSDQAAWLQLVSKCNSAKKRLSNRSGY